MADRTDCTFVLDPRKLAKCPHCDGTDLAQDDVTWAKGIDKGTCPRAKCAGCGQEFLPITIFPYWSYFVKGGPRPKV